MDPANSPPRPEDHEGKGPVRTCVVGRDPHPREDLVRLVVSPDGEVVVDARGSLPGRGAWILPSADRLARADRLAGTVGHALGVPVNAAQLVAEIRRVIEEGVLHGLSVAAAAGALVGGQERLADALRSGAVDLVGLASDLAPRTERTLREAGPEVTFVSLPFDSARIGARVGRGPLAAVGLTTVGSTRGLRRQLRKLSVLG